jgi:hypothetical protein
MMNHRFAAFASPYASVKVWLADFDRLDSLKPGRIVPSHGMMGDASLVGQQRAIMKAIQARAVALKRQGKPPEDTAQIVQMEMQMTYADFAGPAQVANAANVAFREAE